MHLNSEISPDWLYLSSASADTATRCPSITTFSVSFALIGLLTDFFERIPTRGWLRVSLYRGPWYFEPVRRHRLMTSPTTAEAQEESIKVSLTGRALLENPS